MRPAVLYISYDGMLEPLGQSQVLRYLERLADAYSLVLISFEKKSDWENVEAREALRATIERAGIVWIPLRYHKRPSAMATAFDIAQGLTVAAWAVKRYGICMVHARSYVPSVIALSLKQTFGIKFIFDMRGFWPDERVDGGLWSKQGGIYRTAKWFEERFLLGADCVVSLTQAAVDQMRTFPYLQQRMPRFEVITTCADLDVFKPAAAPAHGDDSFTLGYVGSVGVWYQFDDALRCFKLLQERIPKARLHILNRGAHDYIRERMAALDVDPSAVIIESTNHAGVARAMQAMDAGIFFYMPTYSRKGTAPTRLGEFLGCGVPCLGNVGVGDSGTILERERVGVALERFDHAAMSAAIDRLVALAREPNIRAHCREVALRLFSLDAGSAGYRAIYNQLTAQP